ncbi:MAG TPA: TIGR01777 family oxidoreductase [Bacteroidales bacterium]|nr:TIGR01777 family oxidoreductase [Bacteroidales bacterium]
MADSETDINRKKASRVLITGGSGLIGRYLTSALLSEGYEVSHLSRKANQFGRVRVFRWNPEKEIIDPVVLEGVNYIVHLAGANIGEKRWTKARKKEILSSRIDSAKLLLKVVRDNSIDLKGFISASAVGYYGSLTLEHIFKEEDPPADDFLGTTCRQWEEAADKFNEIGIRTVKIRTAVVLEKSDSAMAKLLKPARLGIFPVLGSGKQYMPWIHIDDLVNIYLKAIRDDNMNGAYNAVSPQHISHQEFMKNLAAAMNKPFFQLPVPAFLLRLMIGEMADIILNGCRINSEKINQTEFSFKFSNLEPALTDVLDK